jgi:DNA gyrase subunit A
MLITDGGKVLRCPVGGISSMGRATQGVRVMNLAADEKLVSISRLAEEDVSEAVESVAGSGAEAAPLAPAEPDADSEET